MMRFMKGAALVLIIGMCFGVTALAKQEKCVLAVFNLRPTNLDAMGYNSDILYALISALENNQSIDVMARRKMEELLFNSGLAQSDNIAQVQKAGVALGANFVLYGNVTKTGSSISSELHLLDVQNQRVVKTWSPTFSGPDAIKRDIQPLTRELHATITKGAPGTPSQPVSAAKPAVGIDNLIVKAENKQVIVEWQPNPSFPAAGFNIYRASSPEGPYQFQGRTTQNTYEDQRVQPGRQYFYRIGFIRPDGRETMIPLTADIKYTGEKVPHPPLIMSACGHIRRAVIEFVPSLQNTQDKFKIVAYRVYRRAVDDPSLQPVFSIEADTRSQSKLSFTVEDREITTDGATFVYAIKSIDHKERESALSDLVTVQTPSPPELRLEKDNLLRRVDIAWQPIALAQGYSLFRKTDATDWIRVAEIKGAEKQRCTDDKDLADDSRYQYHLSAYDETGQTGMSNIVEARTKPRPPIPANLQVQSGLVKSVRVSWQPIDDPDVGGYIIYRGTDAADLSEITKVKGYRTDVYVDKGRMFPSFDALLKKGQLFTSLEDGQTYFYAVSGFNLFGGEGDRSGTASARTKPRPPAVPSLTASGAQGQILVRWEKSTAPDIASYTIFRSKNSADWAKIETVPAGQDSYRDTDLKPEIEYRYRIIAEDRDGLQSDPTESNPVPSPVPKAQG